MRVVRATVGKETGDGLVHLLVGQDVPQAICPHHQHIVCPMLVLRQRVHLHLEAKGETGSDGGGRQEVMIGAVSRYTVHTFFLEIVIHTCSV